MVKKLTNEIKSLIPVYNDWQSVTELLNNIDNNLSGIDHEISVVIVNDASNHDRKRKIRLLKILIQ